MFHWILFFKLDSYLAIFSPLGSSTFSFFHFSCVPLLAHVWFSAYCSLCTKLMPEAQNPKENRNVSEKKTSVIPRSFMTTSSRVMFNTNVWENIEQGCRVIIWPPLLTLHQYVCIFMLHLANWEVIPEMVRRCLICFNPSWSHVELSAV